MSNRHLTFLFIALFILSSAVLFQTSLDGLNPEKGKDWWTVSFIRPDRNKNIDIVVTNYSENTHFKYQILDDTTILSESDFEAPLGEKKILLITPEKSFKGKRVTVRVFHNDETQDLFRNYK
jgi:hypothetical protein